MLTVDGEKYPNSGGRKKSQWGVKQVGEEGNYHPDGWKRISTALTVGGKEDLSGKWPAR